MGYFSCVVPWEHRTNSTKTNLSSTEKDYEEVGMDSGEGENEGGEEY